MNQGCLMTKPKEAPTMLREPAEVRFAAALEALRAWDRAARPPGWQLSPRAVRTFILGTPGEGRPPAVRGKAAKGAGSEPALPPIARKFHGDEALIDRAVVTLMS